MKISKRCYGGHFEWQEKLDTCDSIVRILRDLMMNSKYYDDLDAVAQRRYRQKLEIAGLPSDPYSSNDFVSATLDRTLWPQVEYPDIYNYLINAISPYTKEQLKAYKSLDGYNFFCQGWVRNLEILVVKEKGIVVLKAAVMHSQSISSSPLHP